MTRIPALFGVLFFLGFSAHAVAQDRSFDERTPFWTPRPPPRAQALAQARPIDETGVIDQAHVIDRSYADAQERLVNSIITSLDYGPSCWSSVTLTNLGDRVETVELEAHRVEGGDWLKNMVLHLGPGEGLTSPGDRRRIGPRLGKSTGTGSFAQPFSDDRRLRLQRMYCQQLVAQYGARRLLCDE